MTTNDQTQNRANEPKTVAQEPRSSEIGTTIPLSEENQRRLDNINSTIDNCNRLIDEINSTLSEMRVFSCAVEGFSRALDKFYAERSNNG